MATRQPSRRVGDTIDRRESFKRELHNLDSETLGLHDDDDDESLDERRSEDGAAAGDNPYWEDGDELYDDDDDEYFDEDEDDEDGDEEDEDEDSQEEEDGADDDDDDDEEEEEDEYVGPRTWKEVDEAELEADAMRLFSYSSHVNQLDVLAGGIAGAASPSSSSNGVGTAGGRGDDSTNAEASVAEVNKYALAQELQDPLGFGLIDTNRMMLETDARRQVAEADAARRGSVADNKKGKLKSLMSSFRGTKKDKTKKKKQKPGKDDEPLDGGANPEGFMTGRRRSSVRERKKTVVERDTWHKQDDKEIVKSHYMLTSDEFDPVKFLARVHTHTPLLKLQDGTKHLQQVLSEGAGLLKTLVRENFDRIIASKDVVANVSRHLDQHAGMLSMDDPDHATLGESIQTALDTSSEVFQPLLDRQAQANKIRKVLMLLRRSESLFAAPARIRYHILRDEPGLAIREYQRSCLSIRSNSMNESQSAFHIYVHDEILNLMLGLKTKLMKRLADPAQNVEETEQSMRLLIELNTALENERRRQDGSNMPVATKEQLVSVDPITHYIESQAKAISGSLAECFESLGRNKPTNAGNQAAVDEIDDALDANGGSKGVTGGDGVPKITVKTTSSETDGGMLRMNTLDDDLPKLISELELEALHAIVERMCQEVQRFWTVGEFLIRLSESPDKKASSAASMSSTQPAANGARPETPVVGKLDRALVSIFETFNDLVSEIIKSLFGSAQDTDMQKVLHTITGARDFLLSNGLPPAIVSTLNKSIQNATWRFATKLCDQLVQLSKRMIESDNPAFVTQGQVSRGGGSFSVVSRLPLEIRSLLTESLSLLSSELEGSAEVQDVITQTIRRSFFRVFQEFAASIPKNFKRQAAKEKRTGNGAVVTLASQPQSNAEGGEELTDTKFVDRYLLVSMSNCKMMWSTILPEVYQQFKRILWTDSVQALGPSDPGIEKATSALKNSEDELMALYVGRLGKTIMPAIRNFIHGDSVNWVNFRKPIGLRNAVLIVLSVFNKINAEVYLFASTFTDYVVGILVTFLFQSLYRIVEDEVGGISVNGYSQLTLEIDYFEEVFRNYCQDQSTRDRIADLRGAILSQAYANVEIKMKKGQENSLPAKVRKTKGQEPQKIKDALVVHGKDVSSGLLFFELRRTQFNARSFVNDSMGSHSLI